MITNKSVLITGANGGLGKSLVECFLKDGYFVYAGVRKIIGDETTRENLQYLILDVTDENSILACRNEIESRGSLSVLINNAGISSWGSFWKRDLGFEKKLFDVNLWGTIEMVRNFWEMLEKTKGVIVNIGSLSGDVPTPFLSAYSASKAALEKMMIALYLEKKHSSVRILHLKLGPLDRGMCGNSIAEESDHYNEKIRKHMIKIQNLHAYKTKDVATYILKFIHSNSQYTIKTLGFWSKMISFFGSIISQPRYQKMIGKLYKSI